MGIFDRFRKEKSDSVLPPEVDQYYKKERSNHRTAALLLGVATFIITLIVGSALFFGGRAIYRAVNDDKDNQSTEQTAQKSNNPTEQTKTQAGPEGGLSTNGSDSANTNVGNGSDSTQSSSNTTKKSSSNPNSTATNTPPLGDDMTSLPATGDPGM